MCMRSFTFTGSSVDMHVTTLPSKEHVSEESHKRSVRVSTIFAWPKPWTHPNTWNPESFQRFEKACRTEVQGSSSDAGETNGETLHSILVSTSPEHSLPFNETNSAMWTRAGPNDFITTCMKMHRSECHAQAVSKDRLDKARDKTRCWSMVQVYVCDSPTDVILHYTWNGVSLTSHTSHCCMSKRFACGQKHPATRKSPFLGAHTFQEGEHSWGRTEPVDRDWSVMTAKHPWPPFDIAVAFFWICEHQSCLWSKKLRYLVMCTIWYHANAWWPNAWQLPWLSRNVSSYGMRMHKRVSESEMFSRSLTTYLLALVSQFGKGDGASLSMCSHIMCTTNLAPPRYNIAWYVEAHNWYCAWLAEQGCAVTDSVREGKNL